MQLYRGIVRTVYFQAYSETSSNIQLCSGILRELRDLNAYAEIIEAYGDISDIFETHIQLMHNPYIYNRTIFEHVR